MHVPLGTRNAEHSQHVGDRRRPAVPRSRERTTTTPDSMALDLTRKASHSSHVLLACLSCACTSDATVQASHTSPEHKAAGPVLLACLFVVCKHPLMTRNSNGKACSCAQQGSNDTCPPNTQAPTRHRAPQQSTLFF
jgi:hypothetical protein